MIRVDHRDFEIDGFERAEARHRGREEHCNIDALAIHIFYADMRIAAAAHIGMLGERATPGADERFIGTRYAERPGGVELMEETEKEFRRARGDFALQVFEVRSELRIEISVVEPVRLH